MRVYELGKELGVPNKELVAWLQDKEVDVKNHMSSVTDEQADTARAGFSKSGSDTAPPAPAKKTADPKPKKAKEKTAPPPAPKTEAPVEKTPEPAPVAAPESLVETKQDDAPSEETEIEAPPAVIRPEVHFVGQITVKQLATELDTPPNKLVAQLMKMNIFASINEKIEVAIARKIADKHGYELVHQKKASDHKTAVMKLDQEEAIETDDTKDLINRPPVVTFLGHVDHGKTSLLDKIRKTTVASGESGGITQHIGAYQVEVNNEKVTFLDTPGHAAFTAMRARGANLTDIAVIIIAADDGVMPQTEEAIRHAQAAGVTLMVAMNKMDLPGANPAAVQTRLQALGLSPEEWGGDLICVPVSAETGEGIDTLLEMIHLQAEVLELGANPSRMANGFVIEAQLETGMGPTANILVTGGTLKIGDTVLCGTEYGRVKAMIDEHGNKLKEAPPSTPVKCVGLSGVPQAGSEFQVYKNEKSARTIAQKREHEFRTNGLQTSSITTLEDLYAQVAADELVELKLIIKTDTQGSVEAIVHSLQEIESDKVRLNIVMASIGNITTNDVLLASASSAIIMGFHVGKENGVGAAVKREGAEIRLHSIIYEMIDEVRNAMLGLLGPAFKETVVGHAEVIQPFEVSKVGTIAGSMCSDGNIPRTARARLRRGNDVIYEGLISSLKRFQDDVKAVKAGQECGIGLDKYGDYEPGDIIEVYDVEQVAQTL